MMSCLEILLPEAQNFGTPSGDLVSRLFAHDIAQSYLLRLLIIALLNGRKTKHREKTSKTIIL